MRNSITIRCDTRRGDPLEKKRWHTDAQAKATLPEFHAATSREATYAVERRAKAAGWLRVRRAGTPGTWMCPVCAEGSGA